MWLLGLFWRYPVRILAIFGSIVKWCYKYKHSETVNGHNIFLCTHDISRHVSKNTVDDLSFKTLNLRTVQIQIIKSVSQDISLRPLQLLIFPRFDKFLSIIFLLLRRSLLYTYSSANLLSIGNIVLRILEVLDCGFRDFHNDFSTPSSLNHCQLES